MKLGLESSFWALFPEGSSPDERVIFSLDGLNLEIYNGSKVLSGRLFKCRRRVKIPSGKIPFNGAWPSYQ